MGDATRCACGDAAVLVFPCSGSADVGAIADQAARQMTRAGQGKMSCLAGIGGRVPGFILSAEAARKLLVIDGCPLNCAKRCIEQAGLADFAHLQLSDLGLEKGRSPMSAARVAQVVAAGVAALAGQTPPTPGAITAPDGCCT